MTDSWAQEGGTENVSSKSYLDGRLEGTDARDEAGHGHSRRRVSRVFIIHVGRAFDNPNLA